MKYLNKLALFFTVIFLVSCGDDPNATTGATTATVATTGGTAGTITVVLTDPLGATTSSVSKGTTYTLTITLKNASGATVSNEPVTISTSIGSFVNPNTPPILTTTSRFTDPNGVIKLELYSTEVKDSNNGIGTGVITATATLSETEVSGTTNVEILKTITPTTLLNPTATLTLKNSEKKEITSISTDVQGTIEATVKDEQGNAIKGALVTFSTSLGKITPSAGTVSTNSSGVASVTIDSTEVAGSDAGVGAGTITVNIFIDKTNETASATKIFTVSATNSTVSGAIALTLENSSGKEVTSISLTSRGTLKAVVTDSSGVVVPDTLVTFTTSLAKFSPSVGTAKTDANGLASINLDSAEVSGSDVGLGAAIVTASATVNGIITTKSMVYEVVSGLSTPSGSSTISVTLKDGVATTNADITEISADTAGYVTAIVKNADGNAVIGQLVTFTTTLAKFDPLLGTALTDSNGHAKVQLLFKDNIGADSFTATAVVNETSISATQFYQVIAPSVKFGDNSVNTFSENTLQVASTSLSAGGSTTISAYFVDNTADDTTVSGDNAFTTPIDVNFSSICSSLSSPTATIDAVVATSSGKASATYTANGCVGTDTITATANFGGQTYTATGTLTVASDTVGSIRFVSATPENITLKGAGGAGLQETSKVLFIVVGASGEPLKDQTVTFTSNTSVGGVSFSPTSATSNANGEVFTVVQAGTIPVTVNIIATVNNTSITTQSTGLTISAGLPDQNSFTITVDNSNPEAYNIDGETVQVRARLADIYNNPPPLGTAISFVADSGSIGASCETDKDGTCSVTWVSQGTRPSDYRSSILAYTQGVESFVDKNGNGSFDLAETYTDANDNGAYDAGETYVDFNGNGSYDDGSSSTVDTYTDLGEVFNNENDEVNSTYDVGEFFVDFNSNGVRDGSGDGKYTGNICTTGCSTASTLIISASDIIVWSSSSATVSTTADAGIDVTASTDAAIDTNKKPVTVTYSDSNGQTLPSGTKVSVSSTAGVLFGETAHTVEKTKTSGNNTIDFTVQDSDSNTNKTGKVTITFETPAGFITTHSFDVTE